MELCLWLIRLIVIFRGKIKKTKNAHLGCPKTKNEREMLL